MMIQTAVAVAILFYSLVTVLLRLSQRNIRVINKFYRFQWKFIICFFVLFVLTIYAAMNGIENEYNLRFIVGDTYKFIIPPLCILYFYSILTKSSEYEKILYYYYWIAVVMQVLMLFPYLAGVLKLNDRIYSINNLPIVLMLGHYFKDKSKNVRLSQMILIMSIPFYIYFTQSLSLFISLSIIPLLTIVLYKQSGKVLAVFLVMIMAFSVSMIYVLLYKGDFIGEIIPRKYSGYYFANKFINLSTGESAAEKLELIGGSRFAEPQGVIREISDGTLRSLLTGVGMGSMFTSVSVRGTVKRWTVKDHFVHSGVTEALLRTGVCGAICYLILSLMFIQLGLTLRRRNYLAALCAAKVSSDFIFMIGSTWLGNEFLLFFLIAYTLNLAKEKKIEQYSNFLLTRKSAELQ